MISRKAILRISLPIVLAGLLFAIHTHLVWADSGTVTDALPIVVDDIFPPIWRGNYEPGPENLRTPDSLLAIGKATYTWGDCKRVKMRRITDSGNKFVFQIDPTVKCSEAGWILRLQMPITNNNLVITVDKYRTKEDFKAGKYFVHYDFERLGKSE